MRPSRSRPMDSGVETVELTVPDKISVIEIAPSLARSLPNE